MVKFEGVCNTCISKKSFELVLEFQSEGREKDTKRLSYELTRVSFFLIACIFTHYEPQGNHISLRSTYQLNKHTHTHTHTHDTHIHIQLAVRGCVHYDLKSSKIMDQMQCKLTSEALFSRKYGRFTKLVC